MRTKIKNGRIITPYRMIPNGCLCIENGKICELSEIDIDFPDAEVIDALGHYVSPGFIDLHIHGGGGSDFMDGTVEAFLHIAEAHVRFGTTAMYPTTTTTSNEDLLKIFDLYRQAKALNNKGAAFLGIHIEGPYFAMNKRGAQDPAFICNPHPDNYMPLLDATNDIARWSMAPELPGIKKFAETLVARNIMPSIAHSDAIYEEILPAIDWGFRHVTHLYSCTSVVTRRNCFRYAGIVETAFLMDNLTVEIIADGVHLPKSLLQLVYKNKGAGAIALITDSIRAAGMSEDSIFAGSLCNDRELILEDGVAKLADRTALAGSIVTADGLIRTMLTLAQTPLLETVQMLTSTPARIMGIDKTKGSLTKGKDADIVIFDDNINVKLTMINGQTISNNGIPAVANNMFF